ncbi:hypothetical protein, partial [Streptomyces sp. NPDC002785]|uniref:hypothetical protein n=1 Tax=Streptomyces sp. NPDC002785 TaxID=3154543 RepID=UPI0033316E47
VTGTTLVARTTLVTGTTLVARTTLVTGTTLVARTTLVTGTTLVATLVGAALVDATRIPAVTTVGLAGDADLGVGGGVTGIHANPDSDTGCRRRTGSGERGARGDHRTRGYARDAYSRLLGHLLLPPVAVLVSGAAICRPLLCGVRSERRHIESWPCRPPPFASVPDIRMLP